MDLQCSRQSVRTWSLVIVRVESSRESRDKGHLDEENDGVQQRLYQVKCRQRRVALKSINECRQRQCKKEQTKGEDVEPLKEKKRGGDKRSMMSVKKIV